MSQLLLIEDDGSVREGVGLGLRRRGFDVHLADSGEAGLEALARLQPDLVLLDLMLPGISGVEVCRRIRESSQLPIIILSARGDDFDIVVGLESGADDYVVKPARAEVIEARIRAVLRRQAPAGEQPAPERHGELVVDRASLTVSVGGEVLALAPSELKLLLFLSASPHQVFSRQQLLEAVWEHSYHADARLVDACVRRLRHKLDAAGAGPGCVQTVRGFGYRFGPL